MASWLSADELMAWVLFTAVLELLPATLDAQLRADADLTYFEYVCLAMLTQAPDRALRTSALAAVAAAPGHVAAVRRLVLDALEPGQVRHLSAIAAATLARLDPAGRMHVTPRPAPTSSS